MIYVLSKPRRLAPLHPFLCVVTPKKLWIVVLCSWSPFCIARRLCVRAEKPLYVSGRLIFLFLACQWSQHRNRIERTLGTRIWAAVDDCDSCTFRFLHFVSCFFAWHKPRNKGTGDFLKNARFWEKCYSLTDRTVNCSETVVSVPIILQAISG